MSDLIERQAVLDILYLDPGIDEIREKMIKKLPSAEQEIIRCEDCAHGVHAGRGDIYLCTVSPEEVREHKYDFFCGYANRRTD